MATEILPPAVVPIPASIPDEPLRCERQISLNSTGENAAICGAVASQICEDCGPLCEGCWNESLCFSHDCQHRPIAEPVPVSPLRKIACVVAARELDARFACIGNGLFVRTGKRARK